MDSALTQYANDQQIASVTESSFSGGDVGLAAKAYDTPGVNILFDNFIVFKAGYQKKSVCLQKQGVTMFTSIPYDVAGALLAVGGALTILTLIISIVESIVMRLLKWDKFDRNLRASLLMNVTSTIFGLVPLGYLSGLYIWLAVAFAFLLSVLIEGGVLMLMKRGAARENWIVSLTANIASYLLIILPFIWLNA